jgi:membrane protein YqaA with SNARE-associated domain
MGLGGSAGDWVRRIVNARYGQLALFGFSFLEATMLPVPVEAVLAPYMQMRRDILWWLATVALAGFMASALLGYGVGALAFDEIGVPLIARLGWGPAYDEASAALASGGFWAMLAIGLTPVPTQIAMIGAGALGVPLAVFVPAMLVARGLRYYGLALLVTVFGDRIVGWFARRRHDRR